MSRRHERDRGRTLGSGVGFALLGLLALAPSVGGQARGVTGIVPQVLNPVTPAEGRIEVTLRELWRLDGAGADPGPAGLVSAAFLDGDGNVCLLDPDRSELRVYDGSGKRVRTIRPGEDVAAIFRSASGACALEPQGYGLLQAYPPVLLRFGPNGESAGTLVPRLPDLPPPDSARTTITLVGARARGADLTLDCLLEIASPRAHTLQRTHFLGIFGRSGSLARRLLGAEDVTPLDESVVIKEREAVRYQGRWTTGPDGAVYAAPELYPYRIHVFDPTGGLRRVISREYTSLSRTPEEYARVQQLFEAFVRNVPRASVVIEHTHADIQDLQVARDGTVWVLSSEGRFRAPAGVLGVYDVFEPGGRFVRQVAFHGEGDPIADGVWLLEDRVIVARGTAAAVLARLEGGAGGETPGLTVICYAR